MIVRLVDEEAITECIVPFETCARGLKRANCQDFRVLVWVPRAVEIVSCEKLQLHIGGYVAMNGDTSVLPPNREVKSRRSRVSLERRSLS